MQNYIIKQKGGVAEEENTEIHRKDEEIIKSYREKNNRVQGNKTSGVNLLYVASSFVVLAMLAMGVTVVSSYDKMKEMEVSINRLELTADVTTEEYIETMNNGTVITEEILNNVDSETKTEDITEDIIDEEIIDDTSEEDTQMPEENISTEQNLPTMTDGNPTYYEIQYGDTLSSIAYENYGSVIYAEDIAVANEIDVDDKIYEGQQIILPTISPRE